jgi:hypothetical protein
VASASPLVPYSAFGLNPAGLPSVQAGSITQAGFIQGGGSITSQALTGFVPGHNYVLSFYAEGRGTTGSDPLNVYLGSTLLLADVLPAATSSFNLIQVAFVATPAMNGEALSFVGEGRGNATTFITGINLVDPPPPIPTPEPSMLVMAMLGACGFSGLAWLRRRKVALA